jgi:hypothetical protein
MVFLKCLFESKDHQKEKSMRLIILIVIFIVSCSSNKQIIYLDMYEEPDTTSYIILKVEKVKFGDGYVKKMLVKYKE